MAFKADHRNRNEKLPLPRPTPPPPHRRAAADAARDRDRTCHRGTGRDAAPPQACRIGAGAVGGDRTKPRGRPETGPRSLVQRNLGTAGECGRSHAGRPFHRYCARPPWIIASIGASSHPNSAGCVSNFTLPFGNVTQGCALRVQKCTIGRSQEVSSSVPARTTRRSPGDAEPGSEPLQIDVPHSGQTHRVKVRPLSAVRWIGRGSVPVSANASVIMTSPMENALPVRRWHSVQWQA